MISKYKTKEQLIFQLLFFFLLPAFLFFPAGCGEKEEGDFFYRDLLKHVKSQDTDYLVSYKQNKEGYWDKNWKLVRAYSQSNKGTAEIVGSGNTTYTYTNCVLEWKMITDSGAIIRHEWYSEDNSPPQINFIRCRNDSVCAGGMIEIINPEKGVVLERNWFYKEKYACETCKGDSFRFCADGFSEEKIIYTNTILEKGKATCSFSSPLPMNWRIRSKSSVTEGELILDGDSITVSPGNCPKGIKVEVNGKIVSQ